jgi:quercetin dioxygenase-like cupin family protein
MRVSVSRTILCIAALYATMAGAAEARIVAGQADPKPTQQITQSGTQPSAIGPAANFTGRVRVDMLWPADAGISTSGALVTFEPGARSAWHTHPAGQRLVVVAGVGRT